VPVFVDTNVLVYARDASEPEAATGRSLDRPPVANPDGSPELPGPPGVLRDHHPQAQARPHRRAGPRRRPRPAGLATGAVGAELLEAGWTVEDRFGLSCWDALIVAAARIAGCEYLVTRTSSTEQSSRGCGWSITSVPRQAGFVDRSTTHAFRLAPAGRAAGRSRRPGAPRAGRAASQAHQGVQRGRQQPAIATVGCSRHRTRRDAIWSSPQRQDTSVERRMSRWRTSNEEPDESSPRSSSATR
jgi:hypothetical protein